MVNRLILLSCLFGLSLSASAQAPNIQSDTIRWNTTGFTDVLASAQETVVCEFITYGTTKVEWVQGGGSFVLPLTITGTSGTWPDLDNNGTFTFSFSADALSGEITFSKSGSGMTADLTINGGTVPIHNLYTASSFEKL